MKLADISSFGRMSMPSLLEAVTHCRSKRIQVVRGLGGVFPVD